MGPDGQQAVEYFDTYPLYLYAPVLGIFLLCVALNLLGDAVRDAFDPRLAGETDTGPEHHHPRKVGKPNMRLKKSAVAVIASASLLALAACGGGGDDSDNAVESHPRREAARVPVKDPTPRARSRCR